MGQLISYVIILQINSRERDMELDRPKRLQVTPRGPQHIQRVWQAHIPAPDWLCASLIWSSLQSVLVHRAAEATSVLLLLWNIFSSSRQKAAWQNPALQLHKSLIFNLTAHIITNPHHLQRPSGSFGSLFWLHGPQLYFFWVHSHSSY